MSGKQGLTPLLEILVGDVVRRWFRLEKDDFVITVKSLSYLVVAVAVAVDVVVDDRDAPFAVDVDVEMR